MKLERIFNLIIANELIAVVDEGSIVSFEKLISNYLNNSPEFYKLCSPLEMIVDVTILTMVILNLFSL